MIVQLPSGFRELRVNNCDGKVITEAFCINLGVNKISITLDAISRIKLLKVNESFLTDVFRLDHVLLR